MKNTNSLIGTLPLLAALFGLASTGSAQSMATGTNGFTVSDPLFTVGDTLTDTSGALNPTSAGRYTPPGILDGLGAYRLDEDTVRLFANHELLNFRGYSYEVFNGADGGFSLTGSRISYFDIDRATRLVVDSGLAYQRIYDATGQLATDDSFLLEGFGGLSRLCSGNLVEAGELGLVDTIYFAGEEDGGSFNPVGGTQYALDVENGDLHALPYFGHGAWENVTPLAMPSDDLTAFILADDSSPFDFDGDGSVEAAPLYAYVGVKRPGGAFLARNGLDQGRLFVWVADSGELTPLDFAGSGTIDGRWVRIDNRPRPAGASADGSTGYDQFGFPTQGNLRLQAKAAGAFGFSRPEDVAYNPADPSEVVLASTGVDTFAVDPASGNGVDTFGTIYTIKTDVMTGNAALTILYDGDADPTRALRSPDNLDWADDGVIYVQEDEAEEDTLSGDEVLFGDGAVNTNEAGIVAINPADGSTLRVANIDRSVVLDNSLADPALATDTDAGAAGEWESSGIIDVSSLFGESPGTLFLFDVQAHGIEDQDQFNPESRIIDGDLVEGGQLLFLERE